MISSASNRHVKEILQLQSKHKARTSSGFFVIEGRRLLAEAPQGALAACYYTAEFAASRQGEELLRLLADRHPGMESEEVEKRVFERMSDTATPQGILGVARQPVYPLDALLSQKPACLLLLEGLQDPGNLGTVFRTGEGAGVTGIVMDRFTVDLFHPKTVRSTMGSIFRVPFFVAQDWGDTLETIRRAGVKLYAADLAGSGFYDSFDYTAPCGFLIGNEGNGLNRETVSLADERIKIPMEGQLESLNAAMAAGILSYEANRQRRNKK